MSARTFRGCHGGCGGFHRWFRWWPDHCRWPSSSACSLGGAHRPHAKNVLREGKSLHPIMERVMSIHVAEEARHISFAHEYLRKRLPRLTRMQRFWIALYFP